MDATATTEANAEKALQTARDFAVRQAALLVEFDDGGLSIGSQLSCRGAEGVRGLQGMASLDPAAALSVLTDVDIELPWIGLRGISTWNCWATRVSSTGPSQSGQTSGSGASDLIDLLGVGWLAVGLGAVVLARLAPGLLGVRFGLALGDGFCLALTGTEGRVELTTQPLVLGLQVVDPPLKGLAVGTPEHFHAEL